MVARRSVGYGKSTWQSEPDRLGFSIRVAILRCGGPIIVAKAQMGKSEALERLRRVLAVISELRVNSVEKIRP
jgi:hypothetical protein